MITESDLNINRDDLPQINDEILEKMITKFLSSNGKVYQDAVDPNILKPIQSYMDFNLEKVESMRRNGYLGKFPVIISNDNYILDGHHRWLATDDKLPVIKFDASILEMLRYAKEIINNKKNTKINVLKSVAKKAHEDKLRGTNVNIN